MVFFLFRVYMGIKNNVQFRDSILFEEKQNDGKSTVYKRKYK